MGGLPEGLVPPLWWTVGSTDEAQTQTEALAFRFMQSRVTLNTQKGESSISGEITWDGKEQDKIFCCTEDCIQSPAANSEAGTARQLA